MWWMRSGTTVRPKSSRTTEMYVMNHDIHDLNEKHQEKIFFVNKKTAKPAKLFTISRSMN